MFSNAGLKGLRKKLKALKCQNTFCSDRIDFFFFNLGFSIYQGGIEKKKREGGGWQKKQ